MIGGIITLTIKNWRRAIDTNVFAHLQSVVLSDIDPRAFLVL
jgi:hypothetical protein